MAAGVLVAPVGLLWLCLAPAALLRLHQPQPILVVEPGETVEIGCEADRDMESKGKVSWYRHGERDGPDLILDCWNGTRQRFSCKYKRRNVTLRITHTHPEDTGLYLCAYSDVGHLDFGSGTALLVGESWTDRSWVRVLATRGDPSAPPSLVCAVGNSTGPVLVSWLGGARQVLGLGGSAGLLLTPVGTAGGSGGLCEVRFNTSGPHVRRSAELHRAAGCSLLTPSTWVLAVLGVLLLLSLCLSIRCLRRPAPMGHQPGTPMPAASQENEGELTYAQLVFAGTAGPTP